MNETDGQASSTLSKGIESGTEIISQQKTIIHIEGDLFVCAMRTETPARIYHQIDYNGGPVKGSPQVFFPALGSFIEARIIHKGEVDMTSGKVLGVYSCEGEDMNSFARILTPSGKFGHIDLSLEYGKTLEITEIKEA